MKKNDDKILKLKDRIAELKKGLTAKFRPETNGKLTLRGVPYNINVMAVDGLKFLLCELRMIRDTMSKLNMDAMLIDFYDIADWYKDVEGRLEYLSQKERKDELKTKERLLTQLLSTDKQTELAIDDIESSL